MRVFKTEGIIIKRRNIGEGDRILTVYSKQRGKIQVVAKGVRKIASRRSSHIELLNYSLLTIHEAKLPILTEAEALNHYSGLKSNLDKSAYAFYVCELVDGLLAEHQENRAVFNLLQDTLFKMESEAECKMLIKNFEQLLLTELGFWPHDRVFLEDSSRFIEDLMERKIKTKRIFPLS
jgi:DNA repair protein RecO (recombination protein O)